MAQKQLRVYVVGYDSAESQKMTRRELAELHANADDYYESAEPLAVGYTWRQRAATGRLKRWREYRVVAHELGGKVVLVEPAPLVG